NPFGQSIHIEYRLDEDSPVTLTLFNQLGQAVEVLCNEYQTAGQHPAIWDASGFPSGIYLLQLKTGKQVITKKIIKQ
ncbi:MAG: T9SS type A sorting domain-containing protein, partial [Bacteroidales bacterium]|nr:T9SS type A sorting domain-containing protein [Bacteroidales bacterium]